MNYPVNLVCIDKILTLLLQKKKVKVLSIYAIKIKSLEYVLLNLHLYVERAMWNLTMCPIHKGLM